MPDSPRRFRAAVSVGWIVLGLAAFIYAGMKGIPARAAVPVAAAFLIEFPFYLLPAFDPGRFRHPVWLTVSCLLPYLVYSIPTGVFTLRGFGILLAVAVVASVAGHAASSRVLIVAILAAVYLSKVLVGVYISPFPKVARDLSILGHLMLIRTAAIALRFEYRFIPSRREWLVGLRWFAVLAPACGLALWALRIAKLRPTPHNPLIALAEFLGILWVVALSEEMLFRGIVQKAFEDSTKSSLAALLLASLVFGAAHLGFHGIFPNWRFAIVAAIFGLCCGSAWRETRTIQAGMVTHALGATLYRVFFQ